jgi:hypothetical protein
VDGVRAKIKKSQKQRLIKQFEIRANLTVLFAAALLKSKVLICQ